MINKELLEIMSCPVCEMEVKWEEEKIVCTSCQRRYPIENGIPILLGSKATLPEEEVAKN